jgi:hypothetical protein
VSTGARAQGGGYTIDHMGMSRLIEGRTILAGDFNARSPVWDPWEVGRQNAGPVERLIEKKGMASWTSRRGRLG